MFSTQISGENDDFDPTLKGCPPEPTTQMANAVNNDDDDNDDDGCCCCAAVEKSNDDDEEEEENVPGVPRIVTAGRPFTICATPADHVAFWNVQ